MLIQQQGYDVPENEFDFETILTTLVNHGVEFIVVGGMCAVLLGAPVQTFDLDIVHSRTPGNLEKLEMALRELKACYREHPNKRIEPKVVELGGAGHHLLQTTSGPIDVLGVIAAQRDYEKLLPHTILLELNDESTIRILDLPTLIATKRETARTKDKLVLPILLGVLGELENAEKL